MSTTLTPHSEPAGGHRALVAALDGAVGRAPQVLETVALRPTDDLDTRWLLGGDDDAIHRLGAAVSGVAAAHGGSWYRLDRLLFAVLAPATLAPGTVAMAARAAVADSLESLADCVFHGSVSVPEEEIGTPALGLALARLQARARWSSRSAERQVRDVLLRLMATGRTGPSPRVAEFAIRVGRTLGLGLGDLDVLVRAAELQDVGKLMLPDAILQKSGRLTPEEWQVVRRHPLMAEEILNAAPALAPVARLVRSSHERFDGTGYPDGLAGEDIPLGARIIAVCIAFDAMTSDRPWRPALSVADAIAELECCAGNQFDPRIVLAFCAVVDPTDARPAAASLELAA
jgi:plasmid stability protein